VVLVALPTAGLWALFGRSAIAGIGAAWLWPCAVLAGLPAFFPGEAEDALATGFAALASPAGRDTSARAAHIGEQAGAWLAMLPAGREPGGAHPLASPDADPPLAEATRAAPDCVPSAVPAVGDSVAIPYEGTGHSLAVPVQFGDVELPMLFDTGATVTTLDRATLRRLGIAVPSDAPTITLRTANGERTAQLVYVPKVWVGGLPVEGITVGVCEACADDRVHGLLGLNVSSQFLVTLDTARKEVVLQARSDGDRLIDVGPWLSISADARVYPDERVEVRVTGENAAPRPVDRAEVEIRCGDDRFSVTLRDVPAGGSADAETRLPRGTNCDPYRIALVHARW
jgi:clan AA aspartic protease (TIGR02281 family)